MSGNATWQSASGLLAALATGALGSEELVRRALARIAEINPLFNAIVAVDAQAALAAARRADDARRAGGSLGPLHGLPITVKDCFEVAGFTAVNGAPGLRDHRPATTATAVQRLVDAGAIVLGKSNVPLHSLDLQTFNEVFGTTRNPWDAGRTPGGSSGGAAVALATGVVALEIATDLAGSLRMPAHYTGVCSLKPSYGVVPTSGVLGPVPGRRRRPDLVVAGPMARHVADLRLALQVLAGPEPRDAAGWQLRLPAARAPARSLRVAAWLDDGLCPPEPGVAGMLAGAVAELRKAGVAVDEAARPDFDPAAYFRDFFRLMYGEMSGDLPDGLYRSFALAARRADAAAPWSPLAAMPAAVAQSHRDWLHTREAREAYRAAWERFFGACDVLLTPVAPTVAPAHDQRPFESRSIRLGGRDCAYMQQAFWCSLATLAGLPAVVVPVGVDAGGLPVGMQLIAPWLGEYDALEMASLLEAVCGGFRPPPDSPLPAATVA
ncbi:MAG: amidase [Gammaproteobacteria bacterium]|nr:amidase [Gammaproteobacteria bacterium]